MNKKRTKVIIEGLGSRYFDDLLRENEDIIIDIFVKAIAEADPQLRSALRRCKDGRISSDTSAK